MEMDFCNRFAVCSAFRLCNQLVYAHYILLCCFRNGQAVYNGFDIRKPGVVMVAMVVVVIMIVMMLVVVVVMLVIMIVVMLMLVVVVVMLVVMIVVMMIMMIMVVIMVMVIVIVVVIMVMVMVIVVALFCAFLLAMNRDFQMRSGNPGTHAGFRQKLYARDPQPIQLLHKPVFVRNQFQKRRAQHIARSSHSAI